MFKVKDNLQIIREVFMESSLFNLRFGGNQEYLEECELDIDMIKNNKIIAGTLEIIGNGSGNKSKGDQCLGQGQYLHSSDDPNGNTKDLRG